MTDIKKTKKADRMQPKNILVDPSLNKNLKNTEQKKQYIYIYIYK